VLWAEWPDWANFCPEVAAVSYSDNYVFILKKKRLGYILGYFSTNSSGHPDFGRFLKYTCFNFFTLPQTTCFMAASILLSWIAFKRTSLGCYVTMSNSKLSNTKFSNDVMPNDKISTRHIVELISCRSDILSNF
jgi:hypothetical protein